jgi:hypothetical protein
VASARGLQPSDPGFRTLPPPSGPNQGRFLNREAIRRLELAHGAGWSYDDLAELYNDLKLQIERLCPGWRADRIRCSDGSHGFLGSLGPVLVIMPDRSIYLGRLGATAADGLVHYVGLVPQPNGSFAFPPPQPAAPGTSRLR